MPLSGIRVLDFTRVVSGPFCTALLGDFGAEVIKVESPDGDPTRVTGIVGETGENPYFVNLNRNKRSIAVNLKDKEGKTIAQRLVKWADVVVENFRPGVMDRLGLGYDELKELNPALIYVAITGFGKGGPYRDRPAFDFIVQAMSGFMSLNGNKDMEPMRVGIPISDTVAGVYAAFGVLAALRNRERTGKGSEVQVAMMDGLISMFTFASGAYFATGDLPPRTGNDHMVIAPYGLFHAEDGSIAIAPSTHETWLRLCKALDLEHLATDPRFDTNEKRRKYRDQLNQIIGARIGTESRSFWIERLNRSGVPCGPIYDLREAFNDPQVLHQQMVLESHQPSGPVKMTGFPVKITEAPAKLLCPSPQLGEHTQEILIELGYAREEITRLSSQHIIT